MDNNINKQKILSYIWSLKERAGKLLKRSNDWEVKSDISTRVKEIDSGSEFFGKMIRRSLKPELSKKDKKQLISFTKLRISSLKEHFLSVHAMIQKNPERIWDKKIESTEKNLEEVLVLYEEVVPLLFQQS